MHGSASTLSQLGQLRRAAGDLDGATALLEESLRLYEPIGATRGMAFVVLHLGGVAAERGQFADAHALFEQSLGLYQTLDDPLNVAYALGALGLAAVHAEFDQAHRLSIKSLATFRELGDARGLVEALRLRARMENDDRVAASSHAKCPTLRHALMPVDVAFSVEGLAESLARLADRENQPAWQRSAVTCSARRLRCGERSVTRHAAAGFWRCLRPGRDEYSARWRQCAPRWGRGFQSRLG